ncbi:CHAT domain-containing protein [Shewanella mangrovi]|uniref:CHAT domain-containing protein n=1 Tax=Shewanella mangrovi TaxID=1515746 RepID=UPI00068BF8C8|nr:CHAT domain-containing protein [Shewanella mangrovi]
MSLLDSYRRNVTRKREEIAKLQQGKAKEQTKIANLSGKINSASQALSRTSSASTAKSKLREIERHQKDQAAAEKKVADFDNKIARKQKELSDEQKKVSKEEEKDSKQRQRESERQARAHQSRMNQINSTLDKHEGLHRSTIATLKRLQDLPEKIVVLFLASNPADAQQLRLDEEARSIGDMIRKAKHRDSVSFESRWAVQPMDVLQAINELNPTIVHFSGHGSDSDEIVFQDANGNAKIVSKEAIVQTMMASSSNIRLVFFNTCYSYNQAEAITAHVEAAIGMNTSIGDDAARVFSSQFYSAIGFGFSVKKAFEQAKALVMMEGLNEENTPELFVQEGLDPNDLIIVRPIDLENKPLESRDKY